MTGERSVWIISHYSLSSIMETSVAKNLWDKLKRQTTGSTELWGSVEGSPLGPLRNEELGLPSQASGRNERPSLGALTVSAALLPHSPLGEHSSEVLKCFLLPLSSLVQLEKCRHIWRSAPMYLHVHACIERPPSRLLLHLEGASRP